MSLKNTVPFSIQHQSVTLVVSSLKKHTGNIVKKTIIVHTISCIFTKVIKNFFSLFLLFFLTMPTSSSWAQEKLTYTVNIIDRSKAGYAFKDLKIIIDANFIAGSNQKQHLHIVNSGLEYMTLETSLVGKGIQVENEVIYEEATIEYEGTCYNPINKQANVIFVLSGDAASFDSTRYTLLQFNMAEQKMQVGWESDFQAPYFNSIQDSLSCEVGQTFGRALVTFKPCSCIFETESPTKMFPKESTLG